MSYLVGLVKENPIIYSGYYEPNNIGYYGYYIISQKLIQVNSVVI